MKRKRALAEQELIEMSRFQNQTEQMITQYTPHLKYSDYLSLFYQDDKLFAEYLYDQKYCDIDNNEEEETQIQNQLSHNLMKTIALELSFL